ncbi:hypothetical protein AUJ14_05755 [Candidatus Micrarchaeota archaeon CG1_02_55_22]|nr:MAG: hypothetical protein AUJ14_05755 [Candidatus Micrarchaeota archaeon CG1_02_55_22]
MADVNVNLKVKRYTNRVLGVVKEKYGLKDKSEALDKFAELYGGEFVDSEVGDELVRDIIRSTSAHVKKHGFRKMSLEELERLGE